MCIIYINTGLVSSKGYVIRFITECGIRFEVRVCMSRSVCGCSMQVCLVGWRGMFET